MEPKTPPGASAVEPSIKDLLLSMAVENAARHTELSNKLSTVMTNYKEDIAKLTKLVASSVAVVNNFEARVVALEWQFSEHAGVADNSASELLSSVRRLEHAKLHGERDHRQLFVFSTALLALFNE